MTTEEMDALIDEYVETFGEMPLVQYPQSIYSPIYIKLIKKAIRDGKPYTEDDIPDVGEEVLI